MGPLSVAGKEMLNILVDKGKLVMLADTETGL
jgi:hypothetical protein